MKLRKTVGLALLTAILVGGLGTLGCSSANRRVSAGVSVYGTSGGGWGHSISVGIHRHGRRR